MSFQQVSARMSLSGNSTLSSLVLNYNTVSLHTMSSLKVFHLLIQRTWKLRVWINRMYIWYTTNNVVPQRQLRNKAIPGNLHKIAVVFRHTPLSLSLSFTCVRAAAMIPLHMLYDIMYISLCFLSLINKEMLRYVMITATEIKGVSKTKLHFVELSITCSSVFF